MREPTWLGTLPLSLAAKRVVFFREPKSMGNKIQFIESHDQRGYHLAVANNIETPKGNMLVITMTASAASLLVPKDVNEIYNALKSGSEDLGRVFCLFAREDRPLEPRWGYIKMSDRRFVDCGPAQEDLAAAAAEMKLTPDVFVQTLGRFVVLCIQSIRSWNEAAQRAEAERMQGGEMA